MARADTILMFQISEGRGGLGLRLSAAYRSLVAILEHIDDQPALAPDRKLRLLEQADKVIRHDLTRLISTEISDLRQELRQERGR